MERRSLSLKTTTYREPNGSLFLYIDDSGPQAGKRNDMDTVRSGVCGISRSHNHQKGRSFHIFRINDVRKSPEMLCPFVNINLTP